ncbi:uncharacterized protein [Mytilus edulis]|uniref:uncharacterized protein n=1 Tax=Mytilus edulis TaxID=6550 RepID=UPI0039EF39F0
MTTTKSAEYNFTSKEHQTISTLQSVTMNDTIALHFSTPTTGHHITPSTPSVYDTSSKSSHRTTTYYTQQTATAQKIVEGDNITVVCTGDVGKPPAKHVFQKYRDVHTEPVNYTASATSAWEISENCSYYRESNVTFQVTAEDNNAVIRCVVESSLAEPDMFIESDPIEVYFQVRMPTIQRYPNKTDYVVGEDSSIYFICKSDGNPKPNYQWYKKNNDKPIKDSENFTITDMNKTDSGIYTCNVSNTFNGDIYKKAVNVQINITEKADISTTQSSSIGSSPGVDKKENKSEGNLGHVAGIVGAVVAVIVVIIVIIACKRRKSKSPTFKNVSKSFDDSKPKPVTEPRTGDYDYIALEDDAPITKSSNNGLEVEDINKHNEEYLKKQEEEEKKKNESNTPPQPAVYAQVNEASKLRNKQKTEAIDIIGKQEEDTYAETQEGIYDKAGDRRHKEKRNDEHYDSSSNSSKQNSNGDNKLSTQTSQVEYYANHGFEKDDNRKVAIVSPTVRSSSGSQNDEQTNSNRNSQSQKGYENIIGTDQTGISEEDSSHRTVL